MRSRTSILSAVSLTSLVVVACSTTAVNRANDPGTIPPGSEDAGGGLVLLSGDTGPKDSSTVVPIGSGVDPVTCDEAKTAKSYLGCDFWPTVTYNSVDKAFDFAAVVSNPQSENATVTTTGPSGYSNTVTIKPGATAKIYLPWVSRLKDEPSNGASVKLTAGAYHLVSSVPVVAYQFNPLEYQEGANSGPPGKDWSGCNNVGGFDKCYSLSNDASLLLPSTAMTGNYRVYGPSGSEIISRDAFGFKRRLPSQAFIAITATQAGTSVKLALSATANVKAGTGVAALKAGGAPTTFAMNAGDVLLLMTASVNDDLSGSLITGDKPVQVISGAPCTQFPYDTTFCDHVEESLFPVETLGKHYFVVPPTGPRANVPGMLVRIHGNIDGTKLTYSPQKPANCPAAIDAGQTIDCGDFGTDAGVLKTPFEVTGDHEFAVTTYQLGGVIADTKPTPGESASGDPSQSQAVAVEQYRSAYTFLTPSDYSSSFVDVVAPSDAAITLDGKAVTAAAVAISRGYGVRRLALNNLVGDGSHKIVANKPFGIQVSGYGQFTSYQYPGGLNLGVIAEVPVK